MKLFLSFFLFSTFCIAQKEITFNPFHTIKVFDRMTVNLVQSDINKVIITGKQQDDTDILNDNGTLKIRMQTTKLLDGDDTIVTVYYKDLNVIDVNEGAHITADHAIIKDNLELRAQEGGTIDLEISSTKLMCKATSGGAITLSGSTVDQEINAGTGGNVENRELLSENTMIRITAGATAVLTATKSVDAAVRAGGAIYVYGSPQKVTQKTTLGGKIIIK